MTEERGVMEVVATGVEEVVEDTPEVEVAEEVAVTEITGEF